MTENHNLPAILVRQPWNKGKEEQLARLIGGEGQGAAAAGQPGLEAARGGQRVLLALVFGDDQKIILSQGHVVRQKLAAAALNKLPDLCFSVLRFGDEPLYGLVGIAALSDVNRHDNLGQQRWSTDVRVTSAMHPIADGAGPVRVKTEKKLGDKLAEFPKARGGGDGSNQNQKRATGSLSEPVAHTLKNIGFDKKRSASVNAEFSVANAIKLSQGADHVQSLQHGADSG